MFQLSNINKSFGSTRAIHDLSLTIKDREQIALIGPSGSGKSTLLKLLNAQIIADSGAISINDHNISSLSHKALRVDRSHIAYIPQDLGLVPSLRVFQNIFLGRIGKTSLLKMAGNMMLPPKSEMEKIHHLLERVGISEKIYQSTQTLSGGQKQRVAVARALYQNAHTLLADEPVSAVDPARAKHLVELLKGISTENNLTFIMSIHNVELAKEYFQRVIGLKSGSILFDTDSISDHSISELYHLNENEITEE